MASAMEKEREIHLPAERPLASSWAFSISRAARFSARGPLPGRSAGCPLSASRPRRGPPRDEGGLRPAVTDLLLVLGLHRATSPATRADSRLSEIRCDLLSSPRVIVFHAVRRSTRSTMPNVIHSHRIRPGSSGRRAWLPSYMTMARMQMTSAMMPTPSTRTAVSSMLSGFFLRPPVGAQCLQPRWILSVQCPARRPRTARPAPIHAPTNAANLIAGASVRSIQVLLFERSSRRVHRGTAGL